MRFPEFEGEWEYKKLKEITTSVDYRGRAPIKSETGNFLVTAKNIKKGFIDYECSKEYVDLENYSNVMSKGLPEVGDILFTTEAPMGNVAQLDRDNIALAQRVIKFRGKEMLSNSYLLYFMLSDVFQSEISRKAIGTTVQGISGKELHQINVFFPVLAEQNKIAKFLTIVDEKLQVLRQKKNILKEYKRGMVQQIFSQKLRFKDDTGNDFVDWEEKTLSEVAEKRIIKNKDNKVNLVFTNSALQGIVNQRDFFDKDIANQNNLLGYYLVEKNDFVYNPRISNLAPVGPISRNHLETGIMSPLYSVFRFKEVNLDFIEHFFNSPIWHTHMKDISNYGARDDRMSFSTGDFYKMPIALPCHEEQTQIAKFLSAIDDKINLFQSQIEKTEIWKKGLLQQMFV